MMMVERTVAKCYREMMEKGLNNTEKRLGGRDRNGIRRRGGITEKRYK
jgi:hypothetical protein